jgi:thiol:disulfide interchange protein/DsbC/DsbD-like thiol-disulfide interchange protein
MNAFLRRLIALCTAGVAAATAGGAAAAGLPGPTVTTPQVQAELVAHAPEGVAPGKPLWLGLVIRHQPEWHTYWKNPGDSGLPTTLQWTLPAGVSAGEIDWPTPRRLPIGPLVNFGYEGELLLPVPVQVAQGFAGASLPVKLRADWLVCREVCIPESGEFALDIPAQGSYAAHGALFEKAWAARPAAAPSGVQATSEVTPAGLVLRVQGLAAGWSQQSIELLPELAGVIENAAKPALRWDGGTLVATLALSPQRSESPAAMDWVIASPDLPAGTRLRAAVAGTWPAPAPLAVAAEPQPSPATTTAPIGLPLALAFAFVGGLLLNLMPCVFPVLSLKVLGFAKHQEHRSHLLAGGLAYTAGVVLSFVALAALLLALRAGGEQLGWGFQLQSPGFVAALAVLFTLIGLNLAGLFEFGHLLPSGWGGARLRHPLADHALTGVLAVAIASPCTAPFMGASLGVAFTLPAAQALAVFAVLGLGMAAPYLAASAFPAVARALPRPGAWMAQFRMLMAFPMFATVVWLVWVLGQQVGIDGAAALLGVLVALAFVCWALGLADAGRRARWALGSMALALFAATLFWALPALRSEAQAAPATGAADAAWQPWSAASVAALQAEGRPVFVDFTAAWCVTCQVNKRLVLGQAEVLAGFAERRVVLMRADWTRRDPAITAELARLQRSGVPVYALYAPGAATPVLLPELLSAGTVRDALSRL